MIAGKAILYTISSSPYISRHTYVLTAERICTNSLWEYRQLIVLGITKKSTSSSVSVYNNQNVSFENGWKCSGSVYLWKKSYAMQTMLFIVAHEIYLCCTFGLIIWQKTL